MHQPEGYTFGIISLSKYSYLTVCYICKAPIYPNAVHAYCHTCGYKQCDPTLHSGCLDGYTQHDF